MEGLFWLTVSEDFSSVWWGRQNRVYGGRNMYLSPHFAAEQEAETITWNQGQMQASKTQL